MYLFVDTETSGLPESYNAPPDDIDNWPRIVQLAWIAADSEGHQLESKCDIIFPDEFSISKGAIAKHGITIAKAKKEGIPIKDALKELNKKIKSSDVIISHNIRFDVPTINAEFVRAAMKTSLLEKSTFCTMTRREITSFCRIPKPSGTGYKWPALPELHKKLFNTVFEGEHDASKDVEVCAKCYFEMKSRGII